MLSTSSARLIFDVGKIMGADAFIGFYGIEEVIPSGSDLTALEMRTDDRIVRARRAQLDTWFGRITAGRDHFLLIGKKLADLGLEGAEERIVDDAEFSAIQSEVARKLKAAGFAARPRLILKLEAQY